MKILCLHGMGTNSEIFATQTGLASLSHSTAQYFAYYDPDSACSILQAVDDLAAYVRDEGPYNGVLGFSQGVALAAMLLARPTPAPAFRFAVFICAGAPYSEQSLKEGNFRFLEPLTDGVVIRVPTAHIVGGKDDALASSMRLASLCAGGDRTDRPASRSYGTCCKVFDHGDGRLIPLSPRGITSEMARCVEEVMIKADLMQ